MRAPCRRRRRRLHVVRRCDRVHPGFASHTAIQLRSIGTTCGGGSPRFQINVDGKNAFVYIGPPPNYTRCPQDVWQDTGNLATPVSFVDTSQLPGGLFYDTFASADLQYGSDAVTGIQLVADAGWKFGTQTVLVDNVRINGTTYTFEGRGNDQGEDGDEQG